MSNLYGRGTVDLEPKWPAAPRAWIVRNALGQTVACVSLTPERDSYAEALGHLGLKRPCQLNKALYTLRSTGAMDDDPWGSGMSALGAVCDLLDMLHESDGIPADAGYVRSPYDTQTLADVYAQMDARTEDLGNDMSAELADLAGAYRDGEVTTADLVMAARILSRYLDAVKAAGLDY